jgi:TRAP-type C4-dicarboxylate transport system substrate-binding protein
LPLLACVAAPRSARAEVTEWVLTSVAPEGSPLTMVLDKSARAIERASGGKLKIKTRFGGVVGDENATLEMCQKGRIQIWAGSMAAAETAIPGLAVFGAPYLFKDVATFTRLLKTSNVFERPLIAKAFRERGLVPLGGAFVGWRAWSTHTRPVRVPADARGLRPRSQPGSQLQDATWRLLGTRRTALALGEVLSAFKANKVDSIDIPLLYLFAASLADEIKYHVRTDHVLQAGLLIFNREAFGKLPKALQAAILRTRIETTTATTRVHEELETELLDVLKAKGVQVVIPTADELALWRKTLAPLRAEALRVGGPAGAEILRTLQAQPEP